MSNLFHNPNNNFGMNPLNNSINVDNFWLNQMPNNFNMPQNNMNSFICGFPNNSMPNLQQNFNNFGGNTNQMFNMNNMSINPMLMNNMNINQMNPMNMNVNNFNNPFNNNMNNFNCSFNNNMNMSMDENTFRKFNSAPINQNMSINDTNSEIQINFRFTNSQIFKVKAKPNEKLIDVISRFKISDCPKELKDELSACLCQGKKVEDFKKTLLDLNIKNGEQLLFMKSQSEENRKKEEMKYKLTEREQEQVERFRKEYDETYNNNNNNNNNNNETRKPSFIEFIKEKDKKTFINVNEHNQLVYCLTNIDWKCNICLKNYSKENARYYCSVCDYSMCEDCHYKKKYFMKKSFPKCTKPSNSSVEVHFFNTDYHHHRLVFCRSSRHFVGFNGWICNNCRESFDNREWSFYCTSCDFDLCCDCCGFH